MDKPKAPFEQALSDRRLVDCQARHNPDVCAFCMSAECFGQCREQHQGQTITSIEETVDYLTYCSYRHQRNSCPEISPERWALVFGNIAQELEQKYQSDKQLPMKPGLHHILCEDTECSGECLDVPRSQQDPIYDSNGRW